MDLFGNISYKKQLWLQLDDTRYKSKKIAQEHEKSFRIISYIQIIINFIALGSIAMATLFLATDDGNTNVGLQIVLNLTTICIKLFEHVTGIENKRVGHERSCDNFKFIFGESNRIMTTKRTTKQFIEIADMLINMMNKFDQSSEPVWEFISSRTNPLRDAIPLTPISPEPSISIQIESVIDWGDDYPIILKDNILAPFFEDKNNVGHYQNDVNGVVTHVDEICCYMVGLNEYDIISPSGFGWISKIHREDAEYILEKWKHSVNTKSAFFEKYRFVHEKNNIVYVVGEAYPQYTKKGVFIGMEGVIVNIPEDVWRKYKK